MEDPAQVVPVTGWNSANGHNVNRAAGVGDDPERAGRIASRNSGDRGRRREGSPAVGGARKHDIGKRGVGFVVPHYVDIPTSIDSDFGYQTAVAQLQGQRESLRLQCRRKGEKQHESSEVRNESRKESYSSAHKVLRSASVCFRFQRWIKPASSSQKAGLNAGVARSRAGVLRKARDRCWWDDTRAIRFREYQKTPEVIG